MSNPLQWSNACEAPADQQGVQEASRSKAPGEQVLRAGEEEKSSFPAERDAVCRSFDRGEVGRAVLQKNVFSHGTLAIKDYYPAIHSSNANIL